MRLKIIICAVMLLFCAAPASADHLSLRNYVEKLESNLLDEYKNNPLIDDNRFYLSYGLKDIFHPSDDYSTVPIPILNAFNRTNSKIINNLHIVRKARYCLNRYFGYKLDIEISNKEISVYKGRPQADLSYQAATFDHERSRVNIGMKIVPEVRVFSNDVLLIQPYIRINSKMFKMETSYNLLKDEIAATILSKKTGLFLNYAQSGDKKLIYTSFVKDATKKLKIKLLTEYDLINKENRTFVILYEPFN